MPTPEFIAEVQPRTSSSRKHDNLEDGNSAFRMDPHKVTNLQNGLSHSSSMIHPSAVGSWNKRNSGELRKQNSFKPQAAYRAANKDLASVN